MSSCAASANSIGFELLLCHGMQDSTHKLSSMPASTPAAGNLSIWVNPPAAGLVGWVLSLIFWVGLGCYSMFNSYGLGRV
jgi:hypothetical protein